MHKLFTKVAGLFRRWLKPEIGKSNDGNQNHDKYHTALNLFVCWLSVCLLSVPSECRRSCISIEFISCIIWEFRWILGKDSGVHSSYHFHNLKFRDFLLKNWLPAKFVYIRLLCYLFHSCWEKFMLVIHHLDIIIWSFNTNLLFFLYVRPWNTYLFL